MIVWCMAGCFLIGSIPTAYILVRIIRQKDIRRLGSGNVGTMNVRGQLGFGPALVVLSIDGAKGWLAVWLCSMFHVNPYFGLALAVAGHIYPPWLGFQGGKGLATALGGLLALTEMYVLLMFGLGWIVAYLWLFSKDVDKATVAGSVTAIVCALFTGSNLGMFLMLLLIANKHWQVIRMGPIVTG